MTGWWTWGKHDAAEEAGPEVVAEVRAAAKKPEKARLRPGVRTWKGGIGANFYWHAVANGRIVADGGEGYSSKQKAIQGLRAAAKVIAAHLAKLDKKAAKRG